MPDLRSFIHDYVPCCARRLAPAGEQPASRLPAGSIIGVANQPTSVANNGVERLARESAGDKRPIYFIYTNLDAGYLNGGSPYVTQVRINNCPNNNLIGPHVHRPHAKMPPPAYVLPPAYTP